MPVWCRPGWRGFNTAGTSCGWMRGIRSNSINGGQQIVHQEEGENWKGKLTINYYNHFISDIPESFYVAATKSRLEYGQALYAYMQSNPRVAATLPYVVAKTLGKEMGSVNQAWMWALLQTVPRSFKENAARVASTQVLQWVMTSFRPSSITLKGCGLVAGR